MKHIISCVSACAVFVGLLATSAYAAVAPPNPKDLTQGKWELNLAKSKFCNAAPQKSVREIRDIGWDLILVTWNQIKADGSPELRQYVYRYDGTKYPGGGIEIPAIEAITWKLIDPSHVEFTHWSKADKVTAVYTRTVSADGQTMTQVLKPVGRPCEESQVFERR